MNLQISQKANENIVQSERVPDLITKSVIHIFPLAPLCLCLRSSAANLPFNLLDINELISLMNFVRLLGIVFKIVLICTLIIHNLQFN